MLTSIATIACTLFALALSQRCCTPPQWEGLADHHGGYAGYYFRGMVEQRTYIYYDAPNKRTASITKTKKGDQQFNTKVISVYGGQTGKQYIIDQITGKCYVKPVVSRFPAACIPDSAKDFGSFYLGLKGQDKVELYRVVQQDVSAALNYATVQPLEGNQCIPIIEQVIGKADNFDVLDTICYADIIPRITNASVFDPPANCQEAPVDMKLMRDLTREDFIFFK